MPTTPFASVLCSLNSGALNSGGLTAPSAATVALSGANTAGWVSALWEMTDVPAGFTAPAGWSTSGTGVIYYLGVTPPSFTLPAAATRWGKWMIRLTVNSGIDELGETNSKMVDTTTALKMLSPKGQIDLGAGETTQFGGALKGWVGEVQAEYRAVEPQLHGVGTIAYLTPSLSVLAGGGIARITGIGFLSGGAATGVRIDPAGSNVVCPFFSVISDIEIMCVLPAHATGTVTIAVDVPAGAITGGTLNYWDPSVLGANLVARYDNAGPFAFGVSPLVSQWNDTSGNGYHLVQATGARQPTWTASDPQYYNLTSLTWIGGVNNVLRLETASWGTPGPVTEPFVVYVVGHSIGAGPDCFFDASGGVRSLGQISTKQLQMYDGAGYLQTGTLEGVAANKPSILAFVGNGASSAIYADSAAAPIVVGTGGGTAGLPGTFILGNNQVYLGGLDGGKIAECIIVKGSANVTQAAVAQMFAYLSAKFSANISTSILITGNSIVAGYQAANQSVDDFTDIIGASLPVGYSLTKDGNPGATTTALKTCTTSLPLQGIAAKQIVLAWELTNDIFAGASSVTAYANMVTWIQCLQRHGFIVAVGTCIARSDAGWTGGMETIRLAVNVSLRANAGSLGITLVDFANDARFLTTSATYYYADNLHPNNAGHAALASIARPILMSM